MVKHVVVKKCPSGFFCFQNISIFLVVVSCIIIYYAVYKNKNKENINVNVDVNNTTPSGFFNWLIPNYPYNNLSYANLQQDVLLDPYAAPYRDERYLTFGWPVLNQIASPIVQTPIVQTPIVQTPTIAQTPAVVPINVSTNIGAVDTTYRQVGIVTPLNQTSKDNILPLMGRPLFTNRSKWQYYTISNQHNNVKLPISFKGRSALNDNGVDQIYNGDTIFVEGYNEAFGVTMYENDTIKYLPFV